MIDLRGTITARGLWLLVAALWVAAGLAFWAGSLMGAMDRRQAEAGREISLYDLIRDRDDGMPVAVFRGTFGE